MGCASGAFWEVSEDAWAHCQPLEFTRTAVNASTPLLWTKGANHKHLSFISWRCRAPSGFGAVCIWGHSRSRWCAYLPSECASLLQLARKLVPLQYSLIMIINKFTRGNQFSSLPTLSNQPTMQPSNTHRDKKPLSKLRSVFGWELWDGSKDLRISLKE